MVKFSTSYVSDVHNLYVRLKQKPCTARQALILINTATHHIVLTRT